MCVSANKKIQKFNSSHTATEWKEHPTKCIHCIFAISHTSFMIKFQWMSRVNNIKMNENNKTTNSIRSKVPHWISFFFYFCCCWSARVNKNIIFLFFLFLSLATHFSPCFPLTFIAVLFFLSVRIRKCFSCTLPSKNATDMNNVLTHAFLNSLFFMFDGGSHTILIFIFKWNHYLTFESERTDNNIKKREREWQRESEREWKKSFYFCWRLRFLLRNAKWMVECVL